MWMEVLWPGIFRIIGRKAVVLVVTTSIKGSRFFCHRAAVPPYALLFMRGSSGSFRSAELRCQQYSPSKYWNTWLASHWYSWGSLKKTRLGWDSLTILFRSNILFFKFSQFQVSAENVLHFVASVELTELSEH